MLQAREIGQTEITTEEGMEVYQKEKYYILKKNVEIESDDFKLTAQEVKAYFEKDLYDITVIYSKGNVIFESNQGLKILGNEVDHNIKKEKIDVRGKDSFLKNNDFTMVSDGSIYINNFSGDFKLYGPNSKITTDEIIIIGEDIKGKYVNVDGENIVDILNVKDPTQVNIQTETSNMFAKNAIYNKQENIIELFENVIIIRNNESVTGDYAKMNTVDESYLVKTNNTNKRVKVVIEKADE
jgi:lipopolysaccharide export system protein LptA